MSSNFSLSFDSVFIGCSGSIFHNLIFLALTATNILLILPLSVAVLSVGLERRRRRCAASHSDIITYHLVAMELVSLLASVLYCLGVLLQLHGIILAACYVFFITLCALLTFHSLTCIEHYFAVVHPIVYLRMKSDGIKRIRNGLLWSVWSLCLAKMALTASNSVDAIIVVYFVQHMLSLLAVSFCSLSVIAALRRPAPGEGRKSGEKVDLKRRRRILYTVTAILASLLLKFAGGLLCLTLYMVLELSVSQRCVVIESSYWFCLPNSLTLPLLYLYKAGKLPWRK